MSRILIFDQEFDQRQDLEDILVSYAALAARMVQLDCQTLEETAHETNVQYEFASEPYLRCLSFFTYHGSAFWSTLRRSHDYDYRTTITAMTIRFIDIPRNGIEHLTHYVQLLMSRSHNVPGLLPRVLYPLQVVTRMMQHYVSLRESGNDHAKTLLDSMADIPAKAYRLFQAADPCYQTLITKQVAALSHTVNNDLVLQLSGLLSSVSRADTRILSSIIQQYPNVTDHLFTQSGPVVAELTWKLLVYRKCLIEGRMELRVQGVEYMQQDLVQVWTIHMNHDVANSANPIAQYVADLMLANKVVEYLVGVDSHPQLINRSANIVGFLVITRRYRTIETDAIWRTVTSSQDSRTVDAIFTMLNGFINLADYDTLLYLTTKLEQLQLQSFDGSVLRFGINLLTALRAHWKTLDPDSKMDTPPYQLCMRLIREAAAEDSLGFHRRKELNVFGTQQLRQLLHIGPSEADKKAMYECCINDIKSRSRFSTGSISAIYTLLGQDPEAGIQYLAHHSNLTGLVVEELADHVDRGDFSSPTTEFVDEHLLPRLGLLEAIIRYAPNSLDVESGQRLWDSMLGRQSLHVAVRDKAWIMLVKAIHSCSTRNSFVDKCISVYLPRLDPVLFATQHSLSFVEQVIHYESRLTRLAPDSEDQPLASSGTALLWHLASVVPSGSIELEAIHKLVVLYLDSPKAKDSPSAAMEATYVEVVDRCISQLTSAARKLKAFNDGTSSGEDEPMIVVASEEEIQAQMLAFSRSLLILKEFVQGAKSRPMYSPPRQAFAQFPLDHQTLRGEPLQLRYQAFSGGVNTGIKSVEVGDLETVSDLEQRFRQLTGFEHFTIITGGFKLNLEDDAERTIRDMKLEQKGLVIVKKVHDDSATPDIAPLSELMPLQKEIMKHFSKLHPLLAVEDELAKQV